MTTLTFSPKIDPGINHYAQPVNGAVSRQLWLPIIGPSSWLVWGTIALRLHAEPTSTWTVAELATAHGLSTSASPHAPMRRTLERLRLFHLLDQLEEDSWEVRLTAPPLRPAAIAKLPAYLAELHTRTYGPTPQRTLT